MGFNSAFKGLKC